MALIYCPECGTQVSEHAVNCIKCGFPISKLKNNNTGSSTNQANFQGTKQQASQPVYHTHHYHNTNNNNDGASGGLIAAGYIVSFLSLLFIPIILMIVGIILGIITISKGSVGHGIAHILISLLFGIIGAALGVLMYL